MQRRALGDWVVGAMGAAVLLGVGCRKADSGSSGESREPAGDASDGGSEAGDGNDDASGPRPDVGSDGGDTGGGPAPQEHASVVHSFGAFELAGSEELEPCIQWTLGNEEPVYVDRVTMANDGGFHHSNWFVVPESYAAGEDGFFACDDRNFTEFAAALSGTVLTAQSTESRFETMQLPEGVVVKIPAHHKVVADAHLLNLSTAPFPTEMRMELGLIHPRLVQVVTAPFRLSYFDLTIGPYQESRFSGNCDFETAYQSQSGFPLDLKLYYVLPHYHYLGNFFDLSVIGGPRDGESIFRFEGFNADADGKTLNPPVDMTGASGFRFTCGYDNWRDVEIGWGIGDQEMCVMLGLADSRLLMDASVSTGTLVGVEDDIHMYAGPCDVLALPKNPAQTLPTQEEIDGEMYLPPSDDADLDVVDDCVDIGPVSIDGASLQEVHDTVFVPSCEFSSCHAGAQAAAGLDFRADDLHAELLDHQLASTQSTMPLVDPGNPDNSYLYRAITRCDPAGDGSEPHMPLNSPDLVHPSEAAAIRGWILDGALDN